MNIVKEIEKDIVGIDLSNSVKKVEYDEQKMQMIIIKKMMKLEAKNIIPIMTHMVMLSFFYKEE
jgi:hypothetical protein